MLNTLGSISTVQLDFLKQYARDILKASPIPYVKDARVCGSLFDPYDSSGLVSSADTDFWIDHTETLEALTWARETANWPLGDLHDGHEFLLVLEVKHRLRPRSRSTPKTNPVS